MAGLWFPGIPPSRVDQAEPQRLVGQLLAALPAGSI
jgi:hypothetical protein